MVFSLFLSLSLSLSPHSDSLAQGQSRERHEIYKDLQLFFPLDSSSIVYIHFLSPSPQRGGFLQFGITTNFMPTCYCIRKSFIENFPHSKLKNTLFQIQGSVLGRLWWLTGFWSEFANYFVNTAICENNSPIFLTLTIAMYSFTFPHKIQSRFTFHFKNPFHQPIHLNCTIYSSKIQIRWIFHFLVNTISLTGSPTSWVYSEMVASISIYH